MELGAVPKLHLSIAPPHTIEPIYSTSVRIYFKYNHFYLFVNQLIRSYFLTYSFLYQIGNKLSIVL